MDRLTPELHRILLKRVRRVVERARYYPATVLDMDAAAAEVLRPFAPLPEKPAK